MAEDAKQYALDMHRKWNGKIEVVSRAKIETPEDLAVAYTPGVAQPCLEIQKDLDLSYVYTRRNNLVAVIKESQNNVAANITSTTGNKKTRHKTKNSYYKNKCSHL